MSDSEIGHHPVVRLPSFTRGCERKANLGRNYEKQAEKMKAKHGKEYGVYDCPYCGGTHLTTKLEKRHEYPPLIYQTNDQEHRQDTRANENSQSDIKTT